MNIPLDIVVYYCDTPTKIPSLGEGMFAKVIASRLFWEARKRNIDQQEILEKSPVQTSGFFHTMYYEN